MLNTHLHVLPAELWQEIFLFVTDAGTTATARALFPALLQSTHPLVPTIHTCRHFRHVALSSPLLWTKLLIRLPGSGADAQVHHHLRYSKALPLHVTIEVCDVGQFFIDPILRPLLLQLDRLRTLAITATGPMLGRNREMGRRNIALELQWDTLEAVRRFQYTSIRSLELTSTLAQLVATETLWNAYLHLAAISPDLRAFHFLPNLEPPFAPSHRLHLHLFLADALPGLKELALHASALEEMLQLGMDPPLLDDLVVHSPFTYQTGGLFRFPGTLLDRPRLLSRLHRITLRGSSIEDSVLIELLQHAHAVEKLALHISRAGSVFFGWLSDNRHLPALVHLCITYGTISDEEAMSVLLARPAVWMELDHCGNTTARVGHWILEHGRGKWVRPWIQSVIIGQ